MKIYIADLTHTYIALASGTFPLGMAYIALSIKKQFKDDVDIEIFKYPIDLERVITKDGFPDVFMFSNYVWNQNLSLAFAEEIKKIIPKPSLLVGDQTFIKKNISNISFLIGIHLLTFMCLVKGKLQRWNCCVLI